MGQTNAHAILLGLSDSGETIPAASGRISTQPGTATEIFSRSLDHPNNANLIRKVTMSGHRSTLEHTVYNLAFENVSVFTEQFLIEFRLASFTVKSRRYVDFSDCGYYIPDELSPEQREMYCRCADTLFDTYRTLTEHGVPKEDARFVLPYCLHSNFYCTVNARELLHMLTAMLYTHGARFRELRMLGEELLAQVRAKTPGILLDFEDRAAQETALPFPFSPPDEEREPDRSVELLAFSDRAEQIVCRTALAEQGFSLRTMPDGDPETVEKILSYVVHAPRPRALENVSYTFAVNGISLSCLTHFARHRMQSIQIPSLLYAHRKDHVLPATIAGDPENRRIYEQAFEKANRLFLALKEAGVSAESLVYTFLSGNTIDVVTTMNARELLLFFKLRCCNRAQWEIRERAEQMLLLCRRASPGLFRLFGPGCYVSGCPEGKMSCGKAAEVIQKYGN